MINSQFSKPLWLATYNLSPRRVTKFLLSTIAVLVLFNLLERGIVHWLNAQNDGKLISIYFNFDEEANFPSLYSSLTLGFCSYLLAIIATFRKTVKAKYAQHWQALSLIFLGLAVDENCSIHELLIPVFKGLINAKGFLYFPWVIPAFCLIVAFLIIYRKFILALPSQAKIMFLLSGTIYIFGALVMEMIGGYIADNYGYHTVYGMVSTIEELSEMLGIVIFINALLNYLQAQVGELNFALSFQQPTRNSSALHLLHKK